MILKKQRQAVFFCNSTGKHKYSESILQVGMGSAFYEIDYDFHKFSSRSVQYDLIIKDV